MHQAARAALVAYLKEGRIPALEEIGLAGSEQSRTKDPCFVTLYKDGKVVASSGRIQIKNENTAKEMVENALLCLKDPRIAGAVSGPDDLANVRIRTDVITKRRVLPGINALDAKKEGIIFLAQGLGKLSVLLPGIANVASTPAEFLSIAMKKAGVDAATLKEGDYFVYGIETAASSDF